MKKLSDKNLAEKIISNTNFEKSAELEIKAMLDKERSKPADIQDYDRISELTHVYAELTDTEDKLKELTKDGIQSILSLTSTQNRKNMHITFKNQSDSVSGVEAYHPSILRRIFSITACIAIIFGSVAFTYYMIKNIPYNETSTSDIELNYCTKKILETCAEYDFIPPEMPKYIPPFLDVYEGNQNLPDVITCSFSVNNGNINNQYVTIWYIRNANDEEEMNLNVNNMTQIEVNGHTAKRLDIKENSSNIVNISWQVDDVVILIDAFNIDDTLISKILESIK